MATMSQVIIDFEARIQNAEKNINKINKDISGTGKAAGKTSKDLKSAGKSAGAFFGKLVAGAAALRGLYNATRDNIQATAKLNAIIKATGGVAGITRSNIKGIIKELQAYTGESEATIKNTSALLLTFKNINKDIFPDTLKVTSDLAAAMGTDLKSAAIQVGKALNDPATGMTALVRSGITFSEEQKKLIKGFQQTNQLGKAQAIILKELQSQFGGTAAALNATPIGQVETALNQFKDALAEIGKFVLPIFGAIIGAVGDFVTALINAGPVVKTAAAAIAVAVGALTGPVGLIVGLVSAIGLLKSTQATLEDVTKTLGEVKEGFSNLAKQEPLLRSLKKLERGTKEYEKTAAQIIKLNPKLAESGITVKDSYDDISKAVNQAAEQQEQYLKSIARVQVEATKSVITQLAQRALFANQRELLKINKQLEAAYKTLGNASVVAGVKQTRQWSAVSASADVLGTRINGARQNYLRFFNAGRAAARGINKQLKGVTKTATTTGSALTGGDPKAAKKNIFDLAKFSQEIFLQQQTEFNKKRLQAEAQYLKEVAQINAATNLKNDKKIEAKRLALAKKTNALAAIDKQEKDEKAARKTQETIDTVTTAADTLGQALQGNLQGAFNSFVSSLGPQGQLAATIVSTVGEIGKAIMGSTESQLERIKKAFAEIDRIYSGDSGLFQKLQETLGVDSFEALATGLGQSQQRAEALAKALGITDIADTEAVAQAGFDIQEQMTKQIERIQEVELDPFSQTKFGKLILEFEKGRLDAIKEQQAGYESLLDTLENISDIEIQSELFDQQRELKDIQDDIRTGQVEEEETLERQIDIYDDMIESLRLIGADEEFINDLLAEQFQLRKKINTENQLSAFYSGEQGAQLESLVNQLKQIEQDVVTGARREGTTATVGAQVGLLDGIINNLRAQGADPALIAEYEAQRAELLRGLYGEAGFQARAGTGAAVGFSVPASFAAGSSTTNNTTQNSLSINGQTFDDATLVQKLLDEIQRQYGSNILQGA